jgi:hypothetical protein
VTGAPTKKPWWVIRRSRGYARFLAIFYTVFGGFWVVGGLALNGPWPILLGALSLLLAVPAWMSVRWYRRQVAAIATDAKNHNRN